MNDQILQAQYKTIAHSLIKEAKSLRMHDGYPYHLNISNRKALPLRQVTIDVVTEQDKPFQTGETVFCETLIGKVIEVSGERLSRGIHKKPKKWSRLTVEVIYNYLHPEQTEGLKQYEGALKV